MVKVRLGDKSAASMAGLALLTAGAGIGGFTRRRQMARRSEDWVTARYQALIEHSQDFFFIIDDDGTITYRSPSVELAGGATPPDHLDDLLDLLGGNDRDIARTVFYDTSKANGTLKVPLRTELGEHWVELHLNDQRSNSAVNGIIITGRDITEAENLSLELRQHALVDQLTGLPNRRALDEAVSRTLKQNERNQISTSLLLIDLDGFKGVNDTLGHPVGDRLLRSIGERLGGAMREGELLARLGGDEFAIVASNPPDRHHAGELAARMLKTLEAPISVGDHDLAIGASIGYATSVIAAEAADSKGLVTDIESSEHLLRLADIALYEAKRQGRSRAIGFDSAMEARAEVEARLLQEVERGFDRGEFHLAFQPVISTEATTTVAFEALMRWDSPSLGPVPPTTFIPIAERTGAIVEMGRWALLESCSRLAEWQERYPERMLSISVNVSIRQLIDDDFPAVVSSVLATTGVDPMRLQLEITESMLATNSQLVVASLQRIRKSGVRVALDDFGTGYSSMSQLRTLPVDCIKIDKAFVDRIETDHLGSSTVRAIVDLARALNVTVVAEGVENESQLVALLEQQVELAQGYLFAHPLGADQITTFLESDQFTENRSPSA